MHRLSINRASFDGQHQGTGNPFFEGFQPRNSVVEPIQRRPLRVSTSAVASVSASYRERLLTEEEKDLHDYETYLHAEVKSDRMPPIGGIEPALGFTSTSNPIQLGSYIDSRVGERVENSFGEGGDKEEGGRNDPAERSNSVQNRKISGRDDFAAMFQGSSGADDYYMAVVNSPEVIGPQHRHYTSVCKCVHYTVCMFT